MACCGVTNEETLRRIQAVIGKDGYHEWEDMPKPLSFADVGLPEIEYSKRKQDATAAMQVTVQGVLSLFEKNGNKPFKKKAIHEMLDRCMFTRSKKLMKALNFSPSGRYAFPTVKAFVLEMARETLKNDIMATALAIAHEKGVPLFCRQDSEVETPWIVETVTWCYILHVITMTADNDPRVMKMVYDHVLEMREGPLEGWRDKATDFEYLKTISVDPAISSMFGKKEKAPKTNKLEAMTNLGLTMNIMEAMWGDYKAGNKENAEAGYELAVLDGLFDYTRQANRARKPAGSTMYKYSPIPRNWADLFASWDLNFIYSEFPENCSLIMTKLFTPAVGSYSSSPERYLRPRVIALFVQINREMVDRVLGQTELPQVESWTEKEFLKIWSKVNLVYAKRYRAFYEKLGEDLAGGIREVLDSAADEFVSSTWKEVKEAVDEGEPERVTKAIVNMLQLLSKLKLVDIDTDDLKKNKEFDGDRKEQLAQSVNQAYGLYQE